MRFILTFVVVLILTPFCSSLCSSLCSAGEYSVVIARVFRDFQTRRTVVTVCEGGVCRAIPQVVRKTVDVITPRRSVSRTPPVFFHSRTRWVAPRVRFYTSRSRCWGGRCR